MNMDLLKQQQNRGYVIAGGAAIIAFIAFFLPYVGYSYLSIGGSVSGASEGSWLWFEFLGVLVAIAVSAVLIFRNNAFGLSNMPVEKQIRYGRYTLLGAGVLALLIHLLFLLTYASSGIANYSGVGLSVGLGFGWFLFLIAAIAMVVGAVMAYRQPIPAYTGAMSQPYGQGYPPQPTQYPPYQQPYPSADQQQYPPYQSAPQQYPPQQYPQQPYQQPPQQYPGQPQQYPPTEQPPQQYPPQR